jgi:hypothetical protein
MSRRFSRCSKREHEPQPTECEDHEIDRRIERLRHAEHIGAPADRRPVDMAARARSGRQAPQWRPTRPAREARDRAVPARRPGRPSRARSRPACRTASQDPTSENARTRARAISRESRRSTRRRVRARSAKGAQPCNTVYQTRAAMAQPFNSLTVSDGCAARGVRPPVLRGLPGGAAARRTDGKPLRRGPLRPSSSLRRRISPR